MVKKCAHCGNELPDTAYMCHGCGGAAALPPAMIPPPYMVPPPQKKDNMVAIIAILFVVVTVIVVIGAAVMYVMVTGYTGGGGTTPPIVSMTSATTSDGTTYTVTLAGVAAMGNDMSYNDFKIVVYRNGNVYSTLWLYDEAISWPECAYEDVTGEGDLSTGDTITVEVDGTSAEWDVEIVWTEGNFSSLGDENVVGSRSWST